MFLRLASFCQRLSVGVCFLFGFTGEDKHVERDFSTSTTLVWTSAKALSKYSSPHLALFFLRRDLIDWIAKSDQFKVLEVMD